MINKKHTGNAVDLREMLALEDELHMLKKRYGIETEKKWWMRAGDWYADKLESRTPHTVERKKYIVLAACLGIFGAHRFYARQNGTAILYLMTCWTGIPLAMSLIDIIIALPKPERYQVL